MVKKPIRVRAVKPSGRPFFVLRWTDPETGKTKQRSTQAARRREAERAAALLAEELAGQVSRSIVSWDIFRRRYEVEKMALLKPSSMRVWKTAGNHLEDLMCPASIDEINASCLSRLTALLHESGISVDSVACYLREIRASLNWAAKIWPEYTAPKVEIPRRIRKSKMMKGRPITTEEFERMIEKVPNIVTEAAAPAWCYFLNGLWLSGLRLSEALELYWDRPDKLHVHDLSARRPMLRIHDELEKGNQDRLLPITPDFVRFLRNTPEHQRIGPVFRPYLSKGECRRADTVGRAIGKIGKAANIKVDERVKIKKAKAKPGKPGKPESDEIVVVKYASAHDLRRSFGARWSVKVVPIVLKALMRHESIETTEKYYVGQNAERIANELWSAFEGQNGDQIGDTPKSPRETPNTGLS